MCVARSPAALWRSGARPRGRRALLGVASAATFVALLVVCLAARERSAAVALFAFGQANPYGPYVSAPQVSRPGVFEVFPFDEYRGGVQGSLEDYHAAQAAGFGGPREHADWFPDEVTDVGPLHAARAPPLLQLRAVRAAPPRQAMELAEEAAGGAEEAAETAEAEAGAEEAVGEAAAEAAAEETTVPPPRGPPRAGARFVRGG